MNPVDISLFEAETAAQPGLTVSGAEAGGKLLTFLERHCDAPASDLHRWIRTGQVRINGRRTKPFVRLEAGDLVRVPPFARTDAGRQPATSAKSAKVGQSSHCEQAGGGQGRPTSPISPVSPVRPVRPDRPVRILAASSHVLVCVKPAGLPIHGGTGHQDSLIARLRAQEPDAPFPLTPAHRLDKATSGLVLIARSHTALRVIHEALTTRAGIRKTYLAWVQGRWPHAAPCLLEDWLLKTAECGKSSKQERVHCVLADTPGALAASLTTRCLRVLPDHSASLMELELHTGRTHQIRVQLASRGFALIGDPKYGGPVCAQGMLLHAVRLELDAAVATALELGEGSFQCDPAWRQPYRVAD